MGFPKSGDTPFTAPFVTTHCLLLVTVPAYSRLFSQIHHIRTVLSLTLVTVQTDYPSLLSIHRPIHRDIQYTHTRPTRD